MWTNYVFSTSPKSMTKITLIVDSQDEDIEAAVVRSILFSAKPAGGKWTTPLVKVEEKYIESSAPEFA